MIIKNADDLGNLCKEKYCDYDGVDAYPKD